MNRFPPLSIKLVVPCLLVAFTVGIAATNILYSMPRSEREIENWQRHALFQSLSHLQGDIEYLLRDADVEGVRREVASLAADPLYVAVVVLNSDYRVIAGSRRHGFGRQLEDISPVLNRNTAVRAMEQRRAIIELSADGKYLFGYTGIDLGAAGKKSRLSGFGFLLMQKDLSTAKAAAGRRILYESITLTCLMALLAVVLWPVFHLLLTKRADQLLNAAARLAEGDQTARSGLSGKDDLGRLGAAFDAMAQRINESRSRLVASETLYRSVVENVPDAICIYDTQGNIVDVNQRASDNFGYPREELLGAQIKDFGFLFDSSILDTVFDRSLSDAITVDSSFRRRDGTAIPLEIRFIPFSLDDRQLVVAIARDRSEQKQSEQERTQLEMQLRQAQKMEALGHLTGGIAHDFNNILTSIMGYTVMAQDHVQDKDLVLQRYLARIQRSGEKARDLIQQMLMFSRKQHSAAEPLYLPPLVKESVKLMQSTLPSSIEFHVAIPRNVPKVLLDPVHLDQILMNLCINARDAMSGHGAISIALERRRIEHKICASCKQPVCGEFVEITVKDSGTGIRPEVGDRLFEPFFTTKEAGRGTGMGLSTVHGIVHEQSGHILLESAIGAGSKFSVVFPPITEPELQQIPEQSGNGRPEPGAAATTGLQVLIVDDERSVVEFMRDLLAARGFKVSIATSAPEAITKFAKEPDAFDLVITDQTMPKMSGMDLAKHLLGKRPDLPIILYTGYSNDITEESVKQAGISGFLEKPVDVNRLYRLIHELLSDEGEAALPI